MSRIGRKPVPLPKGVEAQIGDESVSIKGPLGSLVQHLPPDVKVEEKERELCVSVGSEAPPKTAGAMQGLARALLSNMVVGVSQGYVRSLDLIGVGYRAKAEPGRLSLALGFTEPVIYELPDGVSAEIRDVAGQKENQVVLKGIDKAVIGQVAADLRRLRPPEPYKGKGIRFTGEKIRHKAGKAGAR